VRAFCLFFSVAIKVSRLSLVNKCTPNGDRLLEDPREEARIMSRLSLGQGHPNVIKLLYQHEDAEADVRYSVLEYASGGELFDVISSYGKLTNDQALEVFTQVLDGVYYLHQNRIVHLDLSLENLLLDSTSRIKICDFGMARELKLIDGKGKVQKQQGADAADDEEEQKFELMHGRPGKVGYMAPEIIAGQGFDGRAADVFSLGVTLFILLTGIPPFSSASPQDERYHMIVSGEMKNLLVAWGHEDVSDEAIDLLSHMLCSPHQRWGLEQVLSHPWLSAFPAAAMLRKKMAKNKMSKAHSNPTKHPRQSMRQNDSSMTMAMSPMSVRSRSYQSIFQSQAFTSPYCPSSMDCRAQLVSRSARRVSSVSRDDDGNLASSYVHGGESYYQAPLYRSRGSMSMSLASSPISSEPSSLDCPDSPSLYEFDDEADFDVAAASSSFSSSFLDDDDDEAAYDADPSSHSSSIDATRQSNSLSLDDDAEYVRDQLHTVLSNFG